jgi:hypothetical protein
MRCHVLLLLITLFHTSEHASILFTHHTSAAAVYYTVQQMTHKHTLSIAPAVGRRAGSASKQPRSSASSCYNTSNMQTYCSHTLSIAPAVGHRAGSASKQPRSSTSSCYSLLLLITLYNTDTSNMRAYLLPNAANMKAHLEFRPCCRPPRRVCLKGASQQSLQLLRQPLRQLRDHNMRCHLLLLLITLFHTSEHASILLTHHTSAVAV